jgi:hypothetical protein
LSTVFNFSCKKEAEPSIGQPIIKEAWKGTFGLYYNDDIFVCITPITLYCKEGGKMDVFVNNYDTLLADKGYGTYTLNQRTLLLSWKLTNSNYRTTAALRLDSKFALGLWNNDTVFSKTIIQMNRFK